MLLPVRPPAHIVPSYSLTGDLLSFTKCRLQYRFYQGTALPPARPVQRWFGDFVHGVLENAYRQWQTSEPRPPFPWPATEPHWRDGLPDGTPPHDIGSLGWPVETALRLQGKRARNRAIRANAYGRVEAAVNMLGPILFPLISAAEERVIGTRMVIGDTTNLRANRYEVHGTIDVVTDVELAAVPADNLIRRLVEEQVPNLPEHFELIVDYKGQRRPRSGAASGYLRQYERQVQTYAWLRRQQPDALPVAAGVLIYINELLPGVQDMRLLRRHVEQGTEDVPPPRNSRDDLSIRNWIAGNDPGTALSDEYRLRRAIQVVPVTPESVAEATDWFDTVVRDIEERVRAEQEAGDVEQTWGPNCRDPQTCAACDFRYFCPGRARGDADDEAAALEEDIGD